MLGLTSLKREVSAHLEFRSLKKHRSRIGMALAPIYTKYLDDCRRRFRGDIVLSDDVRRAVAEYDAQGFTSFWPPDNQRLAQSIMGKLREEESAGVKAWNDAGVYQRDIYTAFPEIEQLFRGTLGSFLTGAYRTSFKILYGTMYKSERLRDRPVGSELWHNDGGPGSCIIVMFYLDKVTREDGALELLPWPACLEIFKRDLKVIRTRLEEASRERQLSREEQREVKCTYYGEEIARSYADRVAQPVGEAGLVVPFSNNVIHRGGYPAPGHRRYVCLFHCYPSHKPTDYERYRALGIKKTVPWPPDPAADF
jgi:hypothetical protein